MDCVKIFRECCWWKPRQYNLLISIGGSRDCRFLKKGIDTFASTVPGKSSKYFQKWVRNATFPAFTLPRRESTTSCTRTFRKRTCWQHPRFWQQLSRELQTCKNGPACLPHCRMSFASVSVADAAAPLPPPSIPLHQNSQQLKSYCINDKSCMF